MTNQDFGQDFYDQFSGKLLEDFIYGNPRMLSALEFVLKNIPIDSKNIFDLGCGIGWSSFEIARHLENAKVFGIDYSTNLTRIASELFGSGRVKFSSADIAEINNIGADSVILIDVFEHIPKLDRKKFYCNLDRLLNPGGQLFMTCPTVSHQQYLREDKPSGLQPVDEDVEISDFLDMSQFLGATIVSYEQVSIWRKLDYQYVHIIKTGGTKTPLREFSLVDQHERCKKIKKSSIFNECDKQLKDSIEYQLSYKAKVRRVLGI